MPHCNNVQLSRSFIFEPKMARNMGLFSSKEKEKFSSKNCPVSLPVERDSTVIRSETNTANLCRDFSRTLHISNPRPAWSLDQYRHPRFYNPIVCCNTFQNPQSFRPCHLTNEAVLDRFRWYATVPGMDHAENHDTECVMAGAKRRRGEDASTSQGGSPTRMSHSRGIDSNGFPNVAKYYIDGSNSRVVKVPGMSTPQAGIEIALGKSSARQEEPENYDERLLSTINRLRQWDLTSLGRIHQKNPQMGQEFTLMSYNILAQCLLEENGYLYLDCDPRILSWEYRKRHLLRELKESNADILCLQEVQREHYENFFLPELQRLGYRGLYKKRTGGKQDGCAILYKDCLFKLDAVKAVEFCMPEMGPGLARDNIALLAVFTPRHGEASSQKMCVANTHLLFNPGRGDIKLIQLRVLLAEIDKLAFQHLSQKKKAIYSPVILCGDMNSEPHGHLYKFICTGKLRYEGLTAGDISGQYDGQFRGRFLLGGQLLPPVLGISDRCQYTETVKNRLGVCKMTKSKIPKQDKCEEQDQSNVAESHVNEVNKKVEATGEKDASNSSSGKMSHRLNLISSYEHTLSRLGGKPTVTAHHRSASSTVDYIFYSVLEKHTRSQQNKLIISDVKEGSLALLGTYGLLSRDEVSSFGSLPNAGQPSDHIPLIAKFILKDNS